MANALYGKGREGFLDGSIDWDTDTIKMVLVDSTYAVSIDVHDNLDDILAGKRVATSAALGTKTVTLGVADAADVATFTAPGSFSFIVLYKDSGVEATSRLICYVDTATGLPCAPAGADVSIAFDNGANKIFKL